MLAAAFLIAAAAVLCLLALIAIFPITELFMARRDAIERDGLATGGQAPKWTLRDSHGRSFSSPPRGHFQLVMFTDHSLVSWPSVADGLRRLLKQPDLEIVVLTNYRNELVERVLETLDLGDLHVLTGSRALWARYNVRVAPFAIFVDGAGVVRGSSLVNYDWQLGKLWDIAQLPLNGTAPSATPVKSKMMRRRVA